MSCHNPQKALQSKDPFKDGCVQVHFSELYISITVLEGEDAQAAVLEKL